MNDFREPNKTMQRYLKSIKVNFCPMRRWKNDQRNNNTNDNNNKDPKKQIAIYAFNKIIKYKCKKYSAYLFIAFDDAA
jgi:hypothetical protein